MDKILVLSLILLSVPVISAESVRLDVTFFENQSDPQINSLTLEDSEQLTPLNRESGNYRFALKDDENNVLYEGKRLISFQVVGPPPPGEKEGYSATVEERQMTFWLEHELAMKNLEISRNGEVVKQVDLPKRLCGEINSCSSYCIYHRENTSVCEGEMNDSSSVTREESSIETFPTDLLATLSIILLVVTTLTLAARRI